MAPDYFWIPQEAEECIPPDLHGFIPSIRDIRAIRGSFLLIMASTSKCCALRSNHEWGFQNLTTDYTDDTDHQMIHQELSGEMGWISRFLICIPKSSYP